MLYLIPTNSCRPIFAERTDIETTMRPPKFSSKRAYRWILSYKVCSAYQRFQWLHPVPLKDLQNISIF